MTFFDKRERGRAITSGVLMPLLVCVTLVFSAVVLAQETVHAQQPATTTAPATEADWLRGIGTVVSAIAGPGFAVWYAYHMTTKRIPEVERSHKETIDRMQADHTAEVKGLIENFRADIKGFWETKRQDDTLLRDVLKQLGPK